MRLIDADAAKKVLESKSDMATGTPKKVFARVVKMLDLLPTIEAEPVRHGCEHCKNGTYHGQVLMSCNDNIVRKIEYCPTCGAKMDGGENAGCPQQNGGVIC